MDVSRSATDRLISLFENEIFSEDGGNRLLLGIADIARELVQADLAVLFARTPATGVFTPSAVISGEISDTERAVLKAPRTDGLSQGLVEQRLIFVDDLNDPTAEHYRSTFTHTARIRSFAAAALPVREDKEPLCVLYLDYRSRHAFSETEKANLRAFADQAALVLRSRLSLDGLRGVRRTGERLTRALDSGDLLAEAVDATRESATADLVVLYPYDPQSRNLLSPVWSGEVLDPVRPPQAEQAELTAPSGVLDTGQPLFLQHASDLYAQLEAPRAVSPDLFLNRETIRSVAVLPLRVGDDRIGVLFVNYRRSQAFDTLQVEVLQGLAVFAAIAIRNSGVVRGLRDQEVRRLELLRHIERGITSTLDRDEVLQTTLGLSADEIRADEASILLYDREKDVLDTVAAVGEHAVRSRTQRLPLSEASGITRWVFQNRKPVRVDDLPNDHFWGPLHVEVAPGIHSELDIPLLHNGGILGVMNYESRRRAAFTESHQDFLVTLAEHVVLAIRNAQDYESATRTALERSIMAEVSSMIAGRGKLEEVFQLILEKALTLSGATSGELVLVRRERGLLEHVAGYGTPPTRKFQRLDEGIIGWVVANRRPFTGDIREEPWRSMFWGDLARTQSEMCVPLESGETVLGALDVESTEPERFRAHDLGLLKALADLVVVAISNAENEREATIQLQRFRILHQAGLVLGRITESEDGLDQAYDAIIRIASQHTQGEVVIRRYEPVTRELVAEKWARVQDQEPFPRLSVDEPNLNAQVFRERRTIVIHDLDNPPPHVEAVKLSDEKTKTLLITPIGPEQVTPYGNLALAHAEAYHFLETDIALFEGLARLLALTIQRLESTQQLREAELRATAAEAVFAMNSGAGVLAHRLRSELGRVSVALSGVTRTMEVSGVLDEGIRASLKIAQNGTETVLELGRSLHKLAAAFKSARSARTAVPLDAILQEIRTAFPELRSGMHLEVDDAPRAGVMLHAAPGQIISIVRELVQNAVDALGAEGRVVVSACVIDEWVEIRCSDSGRGMSQTTLGKIFLPFHSTKGSSGLGLWMAQAVARACGGSLAVESQVGRGTTFTLRLPRASSDLE